MPSTYGIALSVAALALATGCANEIAGPPESVRASLASERETALAWEEFQSLYERHVDEAMEEHRIDSRSLRTAENPRTMRVRFTTAGVPGALLGPGMRITPSELGLGDYESPRAVADTFIARFAGLWGLPPDTVPTARVREVDHDDPALGGWTSVEYRQIYEGLEVVGALPTVHVDRSTAEVRAVTGSFLPISELSTTPTIGASEALEIVSAGGDSHYSEPRLVVWSGHRMGRDPTPRLAWELTAETEDGGALSRAWLDARDGSMLDDQPLADFVLQRSVWDMRSMNDYFNCSYWRTATFMVPSPWCSGCVVGAEALCACPNPSNPSDVGCTSEIWRYDESTGCIANGVPAGEGNCSTDALQLWNDAQTVYNYWQSAFARNSWNNAGGYMYARANVPPGINGITTYRDLNGDALPDITWVSTSAGVAAPQLDGHEFGHALQNGTQEITGASFYEQGTDVREHLADVHSFRYRNLPLGYDCSGSFSHYTRFGTASPGQINKFIGNCHGYLIAQTTGAPTTHYGVTVAPISLSAYDAIWYRALNIYSTTSNDYFEWWDMIENAAADIYGSSSTWQSVRNAGDAIGNWWGFGGVGSAVAPSDRYPTVARTGTGPCVFYRPSNTSTGIYGQCHNGTSWTTATQINGASDPAASEPAATIRYESGTNYIYVFWRGTDSKIWYRRIHPTTLLIGPASNLGATHLTSGAPAVAAVLETGSLDRIVVVYHPSAFSSRFYWTYLGSPGAAVDLGASFDSDVAPSLASYPYPGRVYFVRPDFNSGATPRRMRYASYSLAGGWTGLTDLTSLYNSDMYMPVNQVRTSRGVALAEYGRSSTKRLRLVFVAVSPSELWYATLRETSPGVLGRDNYRAVPLTAVVAGSSSESAGGLAPGAGGYPLWHLWAPPGIGAPKIFEWRTYSD